MKVLIWIGCFFVATILNTLLGYATGVKVGYLVFYFAVYFVAKKLCEKWEEHVWLKQSAVMSSSAQEELVRKGVYRNDKIILESEEYLHQLDKKRTPGICEYCGYKLSSTSTKLCPSCGKYQTIATIATHETTHDSICTSPSESDLIMDTTLDVSAGNAPINDTYSLNDQKQKHVISNTQERQQKIHTHQWRCDECGNMIDNTPCPYCHAEPKESYRGIEVKENQKQTPSYCRKCGEALLVDSQFCRKCGTEVKSADK